MTRTTLTVVYDVTKFTKAQIDALTLEAVVQAEDSDDAILGGGHPDCDVVLTSVTREERV
jgi:hypothetical protein